MSLKYIRHSAGQRISHLQINGTVYGIPIVELGHDIVVCMNDKNPKEVTYRSRFLDVLGSKIHYWDVGDGDPILFLHGNPTSNYLWRNIIPHLESSGRCIAPDLIGMGKSDKPDIAYTFSDHYKYIEKFIEKLGLKNITLVIHDWGSGIGFNYAYKHPENIKAIVFMEAIIKPAKWSEMPQEFRFPFRMMRAPYIGWFLISVMNMFVNKMIPDTIMRKLSDAEMQKYREPYPTIKSRKPIRVWPRQVPIGGSPKETHEIVLEYSRWLQETTIPKLCLYAHPGAIIRAGEVEWIKDSFPNTTMVDIGEGIHFVQEDNPDCIGMAIRNWLKSLQPHPR